MQQFSAQKGIKIKDVKNFCILAHMFSQPSVQQALQSKSGLLVEIKDDKCCICNINQYQCSFIKTRQKAGPNN